MKANVADLNITQAEADALLALAKHRVDNQTWSYPGMGGSICVPLVSTDRRESFILDIRRGRIDLAKGTYQNRGRQVIVLARLDFGGQPHRNPDGVDVPSPHLHTYKEGYGDKWAYPLPPGSFTATEPWELLSEFLTFCNVVDPPTIQRGLFA